jgi:hypothetical protein
MFLSARVLWIVSLFLAFVLSVFFYNISDFSFTQSFKYRNHSFLLSKQFRFQFNHNLSSSSSGLCVITRVHGPNIGYLPVLAFALRHSILGNVRMYVINTDNRTDIHLLAQAIRFINEVVHSMDYVTLMDLGIPSVGNDYGYNMIDRALGYLYDHYEQYTSICQYVIFTNADNFYSRNFGKKFFHTWRQKRISSHEALSPITVNQCRGKL